MGYHHYTVNHDRGFVNPATGAHTNTIEGLWGNLKVQMRQKHGLTTEHKCEILDVYMWKFRIPSNTNVFEQLMEDIKVFYNLLIDELVQIKQLSFQ